MFEKLEIWERGPEIIAIYIVFRSLKTGLCHVQQANFLYSNNSEDIRKNIASHEYCVADNFMATSPAKRVRGFPTAKKAVKAHKRRFGSMPF
jgi:hypothetical protein